MTSPNELHNNFTSQEEELESQILEFGKSIFASLGQEQPSIFSSSNHMARLMQWSMKKPDFKVSLFRLVDVLPQLRSSRAIAEHVAEYLSKSGKDMGGLIGWGLSGSARSIRTRISSLFVRRGVTEMAKMFIAGESPAKAVRKLIDMRKRNLAFTVDLLGEYCVSEKEARVYLDRYLEALRVFKQKHSAFPSQPLVAGHPADQSPICISVKLSALYSQCSPLNFERSVDVLSERLSVIVREAAAMKASVYVDAEDSSTNPIIYSTFKRVFSSAEFRDFPLPGAVVQAYARHSAEVLEDLKRFAIQRGSPISVRLVKGAYWDQETMQCKQMNWESPLWEKKPQSDAQFEKLSRFLLDHHALFMPAFASHNIRSLAHAVCYAEQRGLNNKNFELQMLYGMAEPIAQSFAKRGFLVRLYVPLGDMIVGMGYLVRRLLENTSNESFLRHTFHDSDQVAALLANPRQHVSDTVAERSRLAPP